MQIFSQLFDLLFPPRSNQKLLRQIDRLPENFEQWQGTFCLSLFKDRVVSAAITENKYHHCRKSARLLADLLGNWLATESRPIVLIPIPLGKKRIKSRGYNQVTEVVRLISDQNAVQLDNVLIRTKNTVPQTSLSKIERQKNMKGAFQINKISELEKLSGVTAIIVDDVVTTGATLKAARASLAPHLPPSCQLKTLAFAH